MVVQYKNNNNNTEYKRKICAAMLTENGFMDNELSLQFLESDEGKKAIVALHVDGIVEYVRAFRGQR